MYLHFRAVVVLVEPRMAVVDNDQAQHIPPLGGSAAGFSSLLLPPFRRFCMYVPFLVFPRSREAARGC